VIEEAQRFTMPLRVVSGSADTAPMPIVQLTRSTVEIDAVKLADDGSSDLIVRLHEAAGDRASVTLRCDRPIAAASFCNLLEEPHSGVEVGDGICAVTLRPFELATLRLTRVS
jgi:alpha-mannosidase